MLTAWTVSAWAEEQYTRVRWTAAPEEAFCGSENARLLAGTADGKNLLIAGADGMWLWDGGSGARLSLRFLPDTDQGLLADLVFRCLQNHPTLSRKYKRAELEEMLTARREAYLSASGLAGFESLDQLYECYPELLSMGRFQLSALNERYAVGVLFSVCAAAVDLETGLCCLLVGQGWGPALCGDRLLTDKGMTDLTTGRTTDDLDEMGLIQPESPIDVEPLLLTSAHPLLFSDGTLILAAAASDYQTADDGRLCQNFYAADTRNGGTAYLIGTFSAGGLPQVLVASGDERYVFLYSKSAMFYEPSYLLDRVAGTVTAVEHMVPVTGLAHGFLCYDMSVYQLCVLDPETMARTPVAYENEAFLPEEIAERGVPVTFISCLSGGGLLYQTNFGGNEQGVARGYFILE